MEAGDVFCRYRNPPAETGMQPDVFQLTGVCRIGVEPLLDPPPLRGRRTAESFRPDRLRFHNQGFTIRIKGVGHVSLGNAKGKSRNRRFGSEVYCTPAGWGAQDAGSIWAMWTTSGRVLIRSSRTGPIKRGIHIVQIVRQNRTICQPLPEARSRGGLSLADAEAQAAAQRQTVERLHNGSRPKEIEQARAEVEAQRRVVETAQFSARPLWT